MGCPKPPGRFSNLRSSFWEIGEAEPRCLQVNKARGQSLGQPSQLSKPGGAGLTIPAVAMCPETVTPARRPTPSLLSFKEQEGHWEGGSEATTSPLQKACWPPTAISTNTMSPYRAMNLGCHMVLLWILQTRTAAPN